MYNSLSTRINPSSFVYISEEAHQKLKRSQIKLNDVLFTMAGIFLGKVAILKDKSMLPANTIQAVAIIRISYRCANPFYVYYFLQQDSITRYVNSSTGQSAQPNINLNEISNLRIRLPSIDIQNCIVNILRSLDDKIELNNKINRNFRTRGCIGTYFASPSVQWRRAGNMKCPKPESDVVASKTRRRKE